MEDEARGRPKLNAQLAEFHAFYADPFLSLPKLKQTAIDGEIKSLRSLYWRYFFSLLGGSPAPLSPASIEACTVLLSRSRSEYTELSDLYLRSPDGGWVNDGESSPVTSTRTKRNGTGSNQLGVDVNNPLSLESSSPWASWFDDLELRKTVRQDVQRTFPDIEYFRSLEVQDRMTNLLFVWAKLHPEIGYRQGMHELLAPLLREVDYDSIPLIPSTPSTSDSFATLVLSSEFIEHDTWSLYSTLMNGAKHLYDYTPSVPLPIDRTTTSKLSASHSSNTFGAATSGGVELVQPIVGVANHIHHKLLKKIDKQLWEKLEKLEIEPQLYSIRWLRLIFGREFPLEDTMFLWDGIFAEDPSLRIMEQLVIAMLLRIRDSLINSDYTGCLQLLLRYPAPSDGNLRLSLLLRQAIFLRDDVSSAAGIRCREENVQVGAAAGVPMDDHGTERREGLGPPRTTRSIPNSTGNSGGSTATNLLVEGGGIVGELAKGVYGRAEALGLFSSFNDRRIPVERGGLSEIPTRAPWEVAGTRTPPSVAPTAPSKDSISEVGKLRFANAAMGDAIDRCVKVLEKQWSAKEAVEKEGAEVDTESLDPETIMALTALKHIRDVLIGQAPSYDSNVLAALLPPSSLQRSPSSSDTPLPPKAAIQATPPSFVPPTTPAPTATGSSSHATRSSFRPSSDPTQPRPSLLLGSPSDQPLPSLTRVPQRLSTAPNPVSPTGRPIPPWESNRLGRSTATSNPLVLPRIPPSSFTRPIPSSTSGAGTLAAKAATKSVNGQSNFPSVNFSTRSPPLPRNASGMPGASTSVVEDPLGAS